MVSSFDIRFLIIMDKNMDWALLIIAILGLGVTYYALRREIRRDREKELKKDSEWKGAVDTDRNFFKEFMKEVKDDIRTINNNINKILFRSAFQVFIEGKSPLGLTEQGKEVSKELNAVTWAKKAAETTKDEVKNKEAYNIQEFSFEYASKDEHYDTEELQLILDYAYSNGILKENVQSVFGIELRDELLDIMGLEAP